MDDWKNRLADEYRQTKERYEKLKAYNNKCDIDEKLNGYHTTTENEARRKDVDRMLRRDQQSVMGEYLHVLELRAELHGITL